MSAFRLLSRSPLLHAGDVDATVGLVSGPELMLGAGEGAGEHLGVDLVPVAAVPVVDLKQ